MFTSFDWATGDVITEDKLDRMVAGIVAASSSTALSGPGIDLTGATASTAAVQAFLDARSDGETVIVPGGTIITLDGPITVNKRITLTGSGTIQWTAGIAGNPAITINVDRTLFLGLRLLSTVTPNQTGNKQYGILIAANHVQVIACSIDGLQQGITVFTTGEWHSFIIGFNNVRNVPGSGDGATNTTSANGEDRGDGIVSWGAAGIITGNRVSAAVGTDARVGIHAEGLPNFETANPPYMHSDRMTSITGNEVTGKFRRGIVSETVARVVINGNTVADATWWGIALIGIAARCTVTGNNIVWTRTANDNQGAAWTPNRSGIMLYKTTAHARVTANTIYAEPGAVMPNGITAQAPDSSNIPINISISDNTIDAADANTTYGIQIPNGGTGVEITNNRIGGFITAAVFAAAAVTDFIASHNRIYGTAGTSVSGVRCTGTVASGARVDGNTIHNCTTAIALYGRTLYLSASNNVIYNATTGIDTFQSTGAAQVANNLFVSVTTKTANLPSGTIVVGNN